MTINQTFGKRKWNQNGAKRQQEEVCSESECPPAKSETLHNCAASESVCLDNLHGFGAQFLLPTAGAQGVRLVFVS